MEKPPPAKEMLRAQLYQLSVASEGEPVLGMTPGSNMVGRQWEYRFPEAEVEGAQAYGAAVLKLTRISHATELNNERYEVVISHTDATGTLEPDEVVAKRYITYQSLDEGQALVRTDRLIAPSDATDEHPAEVIHGAVANPDEVVEAVLELQRLQRGYEEPLYYD